MTSDTIREPPHQERLIPKEEFRCIWMDAGIISYKLCEYQYECEKCPFDRVMRRHEPNPMQPEGRTTSENRNGRERMGEDLLAPFQRMPQENLYYHSGHTWVSVDPLVGVKIGVDDFTANVLPPKSIVLTRTPQSQIVAGRPCCWVVKDDCVLSIPTPLNGVILSVNSQVWDKPDILYRDPYGKGWLMTIKPDALEDGLKNLMRGESAFLWYQQDVAKLRGRFASIFDEGNAAVGQTLCDGGERHTNLCDIVGMKRYFEMIRPFFHEGR